MKITILCVGRLKEAYLKEGIAEYKKRLSRYAKTEIIEVPDEKTPDGAGTAQEAAIKQKEGERLFQKMKQEGTYIIALAIEGTPLDSVRFSEMLYERGVRGISHILFVIGGSLGLDSRVLEKADFLLSFSNMTFPHQLMRLILMEQIYRAFRIQAGEPYHK